MSTFDRRRGLAETEAFLEKAQEPFTQSIGMFGIPVAAYAMGSIRRQSPTVGDLDLLVTADDSGASMLDLTLPDWLTVTEKKAHGWLSIDGERMMVDAWWCPWSSRGPFALFLTGPPDLNVWMRQQSNEAGVLLSQYGVFRPVPAPTKTYPDRVKAGVRLDQPLGPSPAESLYDAEEEFWMDWCTVIGKKFAFPDPQERDNWRRVVNA